MQVNSQQLDSVVEWYRTSVRPFLEKAQPEQLSSLDRDLEKTVSAAKRRPTEFTACFLGNSGVGKSTLINALVGGAATLLPAGGVGPLTAQALTVRYAPEPCFEVDYHTYKSFWQLVFGLEKSHTAELETRYTGPDALPSYEQIDSDDAAESSTDSETESLDALPRRHALRKLAQLLITGNQETQTDVGYLADSLRQTVGKPRIWRTFAREEDLERISAIRQAIDLARNNERRVCRIGPEDGEFRANLRDHASGFLAPMIKELTVSWNSDLLKNGVTLVDLPGVGIAGDIYRDITRKWIRDRAEAVVLVVDHRGITESVAELLRTSEFLGRLLWSAEDPADDPVLIVAIVKIDDIAESRFAEDRSRRRHVHFAEVCEESIRTIRQQVRQQLEAVWTSGHGTGDAHRQVLDNILNTLQIHPLSAVQYRKVLVNDEDDRPFLSDVAQSNVPKLQECLRQLAVQRTTELVDRLEAQRDLFVKRVLSILQVIREQWDDESRATAEVDRLREELSVFIEPLRKELHVRQGQYRAFLKKTVPQRIEDLVIAAKGTAQIDIQKYLLRLGNAHWATLRASVRRGGRYAGATKIDLSREFALRFEEPIADAWSKKILKDIRKETKEYASDCVRLVEKVVDWAKEQGARVKPRLVEAQYDAIKADAAKLDSVGRELVNELRDEAKNQLIDAVESPIRDGCRRFVSRNADVGAGVKGRILELFSELADEITQVAVKPATTILTRLFREVEKEVTAALEDHTDPIAAAAEAIVASQENYLKRSDAQKRRTVLEESRRVLEAYPAAQSTV